MIIMHCELTRKLWCDCVCTQCGRGIENLFGLAGFWKQTQISFLGGLF